MEYTPTLYKLRVLFEHDDQSSRNEILKILDECPFMTLYELSRQYEHTNLGGGMLGMVVHLTRFHPWQGGYDKDWRYPLDSRRYRC